MNAEAMTFPDDSFDLVFGSGIIHHLDIDRAFGEIARVLRPGGRAVFIEPLGLNPAIELYRRFTPSARTPAEHPLLRRDFRRFDAAFGSTSCRFYGIPTLARSDAHTSELQPLIRLSSAVFCSPKTIHI